MPAKPNTYWLGVSPEIRLYTTDIDGNAIIPSTATLIIEEPDGTLTNLDKDDMTEEATYLSYQFTPSQLGWHLYQSTVADSVGRQSSHTQGFYITDRVD